MARFIVITLGFMVICFVPGLSSGQQGEGKNEPSVKELLTRKPKIRRGSYLARNLGINEAPDLRSGPARARDSEIIKHYSRRGRLDALAKYVSSQKMSDRIIRVDHIRRLEKKRHYRKLSELSRLGNVARVYGYPSRIGEPPASMGDAYSNTRALSDLVRIGAADELGDVYDEAYKRALGRISINNAQNLLELLEKEIMRELGV